MFTLGRSQTRVLLSVMVVTAGAASIPGADPPPILGFEWEDGAYVPGGPYHTGEPKATGLQHAFPEMVSLDANPVTPEKVELGRLLYFDPILSGDDTLSCAHCHHPDFGFADGRKTSMGVGGRGVGPGREGGEVLARAAPTIWNAAYNRLQFWDGRAADLEEQAKGPITSPVEMNETPENLLRELSAIPEYIKRFQKAFPENGGRALTFDNVVRAIASFERTVLSFNSRFDRYTQGDRTALTVQERRGLSLFRSVKTRCFECHRLPHFADDTFRVIGVPEDVRDTGRASVPGEGPRGAFKVPTLRNVALTAPYMHNGAFETLEDVIQFYAGGGGEGLPNRPEGIDDKIEKFPMSEREIEDLAGFLRALTDTSLQPEAPNEVPSGLRPVEVASSAVPAPPLLKPAVLGSRGTRQPSTLRTTGPSFSRWPFVRNRESILNTRRQTMLRKITPRMLIAAIAISSGFPGEATGQQRYAFQRRDAGPVNASGISATFRVRSGQSIQAAIDRAEPGDRVEVEPGLYHQTVMVDRDGITLTGIIEGGERPILDGQGTMGDAVQVSGNNFLIEGFLIRDYAGNGVVANRAENVVFRDLIVDKTGLYGVYPVECSGVLVEDCVATGIADAAIYVGQSRDIVVRNNEVYRNVAGIEIENSVNALVANNSAHHNTGGILVFVLPNNPSKIGEHCRVINNRVWANNLPNFGKPGSTVSHIPPGVGIFVMAADYTEITRNIITGNDSFGVSIISLANSSSLRGKKYKLDVQPDSDHSFVHGNTYGGNGTNPSERYIELANGGGDLFWDGTGTGNVWQEPDEVKRTPERLPSAGSD